MLLLSCARVKIKDSEFCGDKGKLGATCFKTLSGETREISPIKWEKERFGMMCSSANTFSEWKKATMKLCKLSRRCSYKVKKKINKFGKKVEKFKGAIKKQKVIQDK